MIGTVFTVIAPKVMGEITTILYAGATDKTWFLEYLSDGSVDTNSVWSYVAGNPVGKIEAVLLTAILLIIMYLLSLAFCSAGNKLLAKLTSSVVRDIRGEIDEKMHRMTLNYYDSRTNGEILSVITNDVDAVNTLLGKNSYTVIGQLVSLVGTLIMLFIVNGWLALIAVLMIPGTLLLTGPVQKKSSKYYADQQNLLGDVNGYVEETFNGQTVITAFNYQNRATKYFDEKNDELRGTAKNAESYSALVMPLTQMVNYIGYGIAALVGCIFAIKGRMTVGNVQSALQYINNFQQPFTTISQMSGQLSSAIAAGERIFALLDEEEKIRIPKTERSRPTATARWRSSMSSSVTHLTTY